jgi:hypothetical protein
MEYDAFLRMGMRSKESLVSIGALSHRHFVYKPRHLLLPSPRAECLTGFSQGLRAGSCAAVEVAEIECDLALSTTRVACERKLANSRGNMFVMC